MTTHPDLNRFRFDATLASAVAGKRVLITGSGKEGGIGQALAFAAALNGAEVVGVHFHRSYGEGMATVDAINAAGGHAFPVQADVTNTSDLWAMRSHVMRRMGGKPPDVVICNSGLSEQGYRLGRVPKSRDGEQAALRRARARQGFVENLEESNAVVHTKIDGFLYLTHLWAGEATYAGTQLQMIYISSRQAIDPGAGVPGYVLANFGVLALPTILRVNLGEGARNVTAFSVALPFVRTAMTETYADNARVFGRWQPRMLQTHEVAEAFLQLLGRPPEELDERTVQLDAETAGDELRLTWSAVDLLPRTEQLSWSQGAPLHYAGPGASSAA